MTDESVDRKRQRARQRNEQLAQRVMRWGRVRLALSLLFFVVGVVIVWALRSPATAFPFFGLAVLFLILCLDAYGQAREIGRRNWKSLFPVPSVRARSTEERGPKRTQASL